MKALISLALTSMVLTTSANNAHAQLSLLPDEVRSVALRAWDAAGSMASSALEYVTPSNASGLLSKQILEHDEDSDLNFKALMSAAGYSIKRIDTGISVVPHLSVKYGRSRELAEYDIYYAHRLLRKHARLHNRPVNYVQRAIVSAILDVQGLKSYTLESVAVDILPLPRVQFVSVPNNAPLGEDAGRLMRAIERLNEAVSQK
jgi:hypothetical protein